MLMQISTLTLVAAAFGAVAVAAPVENSAQIVARDIVDSSDAAIGNMQPRMVNSNTALVAGENMAKRQTYYPDCGAPICFDVAGMAYKNKEKRDVADVVAEDGLAKRYNPKYYPDCGAPICFDAVGRAHENKEKRYNPKYYPDCGAPICFDEAGKVYENNEKGVAESPAVLEKKNAVPVVEPAAMPVSTALQTVTPPPARS